MPSKATRYRPTTDIHAELQAERIERERKSRHAGSVATLRKLLSRPILANELTLIEQPSRNAPFSIIGGGDDCAGSFETCQDRILDEIDRRNAARHIVEVELPDDAENDQNSDEASCDPLATTPT